MWMPSFLRKDSSPVTEATPSVLAAPANIARTGFEYGIGPEGLREWSQSMGSATQTDRRSMLQQLYESYLACPWSWAAVNAISRTITAGGLVFDWDNDDGEGDQDQPEKPPNVLACERLFQFCNKREDIRQLMRSVIADLLVFGDAFIEVVWMAGYPVALYSLDSPSLSVLADPHGEVTGYVQNTEHGQRATFEPNEVIHISLDSPRSGIFGVAPTQAALLPITAWLFAAATLKETFRKGNPSTIHVDHPQSMSEPETNRWSARYMQRNIGPRNIGVPVVTRGGGTVKELAASRIDEFLHTLDQKRDEILATYGVPPAEATVIESGNLGGGTGESQRKALDLATMIPTPAGWTTMGALRIGDEVLDEAGQPCRVTGTYEVPDAESYRLEFSDGTHIDCCADHLWVTWTYEDRKAFGRSVGRETGAGMPENWPTWKTHRGSGPKIRRTSEVAETLTAYQGRTNHSIPVAGALHLPELPLPIDPYVLGVWLGDGTSVNGAVAIGRGDEQTLAEIRHAGYGVTERHSSRNSGRCPAYTVTALLPELRELGVLDNKHVPAQYLRGSIEQRLALLQGLMDSDGGPGNGQVTFCSTIEGLADAVVELARSLGQKPVKSKRRSVCNGVDYGPAYEVKWAPTVQVFRLARKVRRTPVFTGHGALRAMHRRITSATRIPNRPMRCITVDSPNEMYLAGEGMIPTHNTFLVNTCGPIAALVLEKINYHLCKLGFSIEGWHVKFLEVDMRDSKTVEDIRDMRLRNGSWLLNKYRAEIGEPPVEGGDQAVLVDRQNIVLWRDMAARSTAGIAFQLKGTALEPGGAPETELDPDAPVTLQKALPPAPPPDMTSQIPQDDPDVDPAGPSGDVPGGETGHSGRPLRETYRGRLARALRELP